MGGASSQQHPAFSPNKLAMPSSVSIGSPAEFSKLLSSSTIVIADFYADWCGPCKTIAPTYESLAAKYSKPNKITFTKVNVDSQQEIAQKYGVRAMPTFMIFRSGSTINTIRGADVRGLTNAIEALLRCRRSWSLLLVCWTNTRRTCSPSIPIPRLQLQGNNRCDHRLPGPVLYKPVFVRCVCSC